MTDTTLKILMVDDSNIQLDYQCMLLADQDFTLITASNGAEALQLALTERPDVILMDIEMPGMNGFEAARRLRLEEATAAIPIIMVSAQTELEYVEQAFLDGCSDYITKPVHKADVLAKISGLTGVTTGAAS